MAAYLWSDYSSYKRKADVVVNGGDQDREGQLLIDEILEYVRYKGEVRPLLNMVLKLYQMQTQVFRAAVLMMVR